MPPETGSWDIRVLSARYDYDGDAVEIYGVTREGESLLAICKGFRPYFEICEADPNYIEDLENDPGVVKLEGISLWVNGGQRDCHKVFLNTPREVPAYKDVAKRRCDKVLAADIPFHHRFLYDNKVEACTTIKGRIIEDSDRKRDYTTRYVVETDSFDICEPFNPQLSIFSFDIENSIVDKHLYTICYVFENHEGRQEGCIHGPGNAHDMEAEKLMLEEFVEKVHQYDPDIITGYNIDNYDLVQLDNRAAVHGVKLNIGRDHGKMNRVRDQFWRIHGRIVADAWWNAKITIRPKKETLNHLAKLLLDEEKLDVDPRKIEQEWEADAEKVKRYCLKDADLALRILQKIDVVGRNLDLATVSKLPLDDVLNGRTSTLIDSLVIRRADERGIGIPMNRYGTKSKKIEGAYVHTISPGIYDWTCVLDFKSMYPSIMIANNICLTTLDPNGEIESPLGVRFVTKDKREGLVPELLVGLMNDRDEAKKKMKAADTESERYHYNGLQNAIKVLMNSFYGVFASSFYRLTDKQIGASITAYARQNIKTIITQLEKEGTKVLYGDTDSVFFQSPKDDLKSTIAYGEGIADRFSKEGMTLEFEKILNPMFTHGKKKRYVGKIVWPEEDIVVRGYETRRTDAFDFQQRSLMEIFERILEHDEEGAISHAKERIDILRNGEVPLERLVISRTCKEFSFYKDPNTQATVQTAKKLMDMGFNFVPGMKVSWIVVNSRRQPQQVEPWIDGQEFTLKPDYEYYAERIAATLARATEVFGVDERELLTGTSQKTLFEGWGSNVPGEKKIAAKKEKIKPAKPEKESGKLDQWF